MSAVEGSKQTHVETENVNVTDTLSGTTAMMDCAELPYFKGVLMQRAVMFWVWVVYAEQLMSCVVSPQPRGAFRVTGS